MTRGGPRYTAHGPRGYICVYRRVQRARQDKHESKVIKKKCLLELLYEYQCFYIVSGNNVGYHNFKFALGRDIKLCSYIDMCYNMGVLSNIKKVRKPLAYTCMNSRRIN
jgi:hypothetical protein